MSEENDIYQQDVPMEEEIEAMMPVGYADGDDFFNPEAWTGETEADSASADGALPEGEGTQSDTGTEGAPATEPTEEPAPADNGDDDDAPAPATDEPETTPSTKRRVRYQFDHEDREEEIDDADLPELLQKARSVDRYKQRLDSAQSVQDKLSNTARALKYDNAEAFLDAILENARASEMENLRGKGVPDELAEDYIQRKYGAVPAAPAQREEPPEPQRTQDGARDYVSEAKELLSARPGLAGKELPAEVYAAASQPGVTLLQAYTEYERKASVAEAEKAKTEAEKLRKENRILKNNADSADRAPVSGVSKGGRAEDTSANDPFLKGFNSIFD